MSFILYNGRGSPHLCLPLKPARAYLILKYLLISALSVWLDSVIGGKKIDKFGISGNAGV